MAPPEHRDDMTWSHRLIQSAGADLRTETIGDRADPQSCCSLTRLTRPVRGGTSSVSVWPLGCGLSFATPGARQLRPRSWPRMPWPC